MDLLRVGFIFVWTILTLVFSGFVLWRKLKRERIDFEDKIIDRALLSVFLGLLAGRIIYIVFHFSTFGFSLVKWLSVGALPGIIDVAAISVGLLIFWLSLGKEWKDPMEVLDYTSIGLAFLLFFTSLGNILLQALTFSLANILGSSVILPTFDLQTFLSPVILSTSYLILFIFLSRVEKKYRTFLWYRSKRRSAQTGFVTAAFLIGYGLFGLVLGINIESLLKLLVIIAGIVLLYVRSGRMLLGNK